MFITYSLTSHSIDMIGKALAVPRRRLMRVHDFSASLCDQLFSLTLILDLPEGQIERMRSVFEKIYEVETIESHVKRIP